MNHVGKNVKLGDNVRMWHFTYIGDGAEIGDNTKIGSLVHIDYGVKIGSDCKIEGSAYIPPLTVIGDGVFVGPGAIFTNDPFPMSPKMVGVTVEDGAIICAGAVCTLWKSILRRKENGSEITTPECLSFEESSPRGNAGLMPSLGLRYERHVTLVCDPYIR
jgi:NDP-sugar pyrophosphorylase family protein